MKNTENAKPQNEIRIGFNTRVRSVLQYANTLIKDNNFKTIKMSAIGGAIGSLVSAVELLKITNKGLYQVNKIGTVSYQTVDQGGDVQSQRLYPKFEVTLTFDAPTEKGEGYQDKLSDEKFNELSAANEASQKERETKVEKTREEYGESRGRRGYRGESRGRGGYRGESRGRGGYRGQSRGRGFGGPSRGRGFGGPSRGRGFGGPSRGRGFGGPSRGRGFGGPSTGRGFGGPSRGRGFGGPSRGRGGF